MKTALLVSYVAAACACATSREGGREGEEDGEEGQTGRHRQVDRQT